MSFDNVGSGSVALAPYWFKALHFPAGQLTVCGVRGEERLSEPFSWEVTVTASALVGDAVERLAVDSRRVSWFARARSLG